MAVKVYLPQEGSIQVHAQRVTKCPPNFPSGYYWYGNRRKGPGRPPKWLDRMMSSSSGTIDVTDDTNDVDTDVDEDTEPSNSTTDGSTGEAEDAADVSESVPDPTTFTRTRTRTVVPPKRFM